MDVDALLNSDSDGEQSASTRAPKRPPPSATATALPKALKPAAPAKPPTAQPPSIQLLPQQPPTAMDMVESRTTRTAPAPSPPRQLPTSQPTTQPGSATAAPTAPTAAPAAQLPPVRNSEPQTADAWRARGNDLFKAGQFAYAKDCYTRRCGHYN